MSTDKRLAAEYVRELSRLEGITAINVGGSRSPKSTNSATRNSDWDFHVIMVNPSKLPQPSEWGLHGETHGFSSARKKDVEVWPTDEFKLIK